jgi:hypothetical protein
MCTWIESATHRPPTAGAAGINGDLVNAIEPRKRHNCECSQYSAPEIVHDVQDCPALAKVAG